MTSVKTLIKEYNCRKGLCCYCEYDRLDGGRCGECKNKEWFVDKVDLRSYIADRVADEAKKVFIESDNGIHLKTKMEIRESVYEDFSHYVDSQKEKFDKLLDEYCVLYNAAKSDYEDAMKSYIAVQVHAALKELYGELT